MLRLWITLLLCLWLTDSAWAQVTTALPVTATSNGETIASEGTLQSLDASLATLVGNQGLDGTHGNNVPATGPGILGEGKDFDGSALPNTVTEGQAARIAVTLSGIPFGFLTNEAGTKELGKEEDAAHASADYGVPIWCVRDDTIGIASGTEGDYEPCHTDASGALWTNEINVKNEDTTETSGLALFVAGTVRRDVAAASANASGDYATANTDALGLMWTRFLDPCSGVNKVSVPIDIVTATTTEVVGTASGASTAIYICSINIGPVGGAQNLALVEDDTDACMSPTAGVAGGVTAGEGWNIAANGGLTLGNGLGTIAKTAGTNVYLCLISSAAVQTSGVITYALAP